MTGEGSEYSRRKREEHREYSDEETGRIVRESIDEVLKEIEGKESSEPLELPEQVYDSERCVREAIEEVQQEEAERLRLKEQKELEDEQQESKEIPEEYDAERCVKEAIAEVRQEEAERQRLREEREHAEMEKKEQLEASREERKETAEKDDFEEFEERIIENFGEYGIDPEELKERWRKKFEEEVQDELGEKSGKETEGEEDETSGHEKTVDGHYYFDDGSGQIYEVKMDSKESSGTETESCSEVQVDPEGIPSTSEKEENTESKKGSGEIEPEEVKPTQETENAMKERPKKREANEQEESPEIHLTREKKSSKESISTPETKPQSSESEDLVESEDSQDAEEKGEEKSESREEEIWREYEIEYGSLEDKAYKRWLKEVMDALPEEEQERFDKIIKEKVVTIEDVEELARKHGLDELLEDEEVVEEVRNYLKIRSILENEPDSDIKKLAEEMEIDVELAEEWSRGESEPYSLKKLLNLEAFYLWDEIIRNHREQNYPSSREELEKILESNSELKEDRLFQLELDDAIAYIEIMAMRRRGEIKKRIRNGRETYSRKQIMELSKKYGISAQEIISWLRGEHTPTLIDKIGKTSEVKEARQKSTSNGVDLNEVHRLYFGEGLTLLEVGKQLVLSTNEVRRIFREQGWIPRQGGGQRKDIDLNEIHRLYYIEKWTLKEIAKKVGMDEHTIGKIFKEQGWETRRAAAIRRMKSLETIMATKKKQSKSGKISKSAITKEGEKRISPSMHLKIDIDRIHALYYNDGLWREEIAQKLGLSYYVVRKVFIEMGWPSKIRKFETEEERRTAKKESKREIARKTVGLREKLFGIKCKICGVSKKKKTLSIHRKDGSEHDKDILWKVRFLRTVNPDEWAALCPSCHPGVHWMMDTFNLEFENIKEIDVSNHKKMSVEKKPFYQLDANAQVSEKYLQMKQNNLDGDVDLRRLLFGETCFFCGVHHSEKTLIIHRKDGKPHDINLIRSERNLSKLNPDEWSSLCQKCHREVHWAMDTLLIDWKELEDLKKGK